MLIPKLSVITTVFNNKETLEACILSVRAQTYPNVEYIVIDGGSTDGSILVLKKYADKIDHWISESDSGIYSAINKGLALCTGDFYLFLGSDDLLLPKALETLYEGSMNNLAVRALSYFSDPGSNRVALIRAHSSATLISMAAHRRFGLYDESYRIAADAKFMATLCKNGLVNDVDEVVGIFAPGGASSRYLPTVLEHARAMRESGVWGVFYSFLWVKSRKTFYSIKLLFRG